jgi:hypothetical protein
MYYDNFIFSMVANIMGVPAEEKFSTKSRDFSPPFVLFWFLGSCSLYLQWPPKTPSLELLRGGGTLRGEA